MKFEIGEKYRFDPPLEITAYAVTDQRRIKEPSPVFTEGVLRRDYVNTLQFEGKSRGEPCVFYIRKDRMSKLSITRAPKLYLVKS